MQTQGSLVNIASLSMNDKHFLWGYLTRIRFKHINTKK